MTECQAVERAGLANNVAIGAGDKGERKVVLTYLSGPWPGIYTFADGRLKVIDRAPEQPKPAKSAPKKTPKKKAGAPKTASHEIERRLRPIIASTQLVQCAVAILALVDNQVETRRPLITDNAGQ